MFVSPRHLFDEERTKSDIHKQVSGGGTNIGNRIFLKVFYTAPFLLLFTNSIIPSYPAQV